MTITLPYPTPIADGYDPVPGNNNSPPPTGAPEGQATSTVNDSMRDTKAAVNQNWQNVEAVNNALGTMAEQDASAVAITGGTIDAAVSVALAVNSTQFGGLTLQQLYDFMYPVGTVVYRGDSETAPTPPTGVTATWALFGEGNYPKYIQTGQVVGEIFGSSNTDPAGGHNHGGNTGATALTEAQLPAHTHDTTAVGSGGAGTAAGTGIATSATPITSDSTGSGDTHTHTISSQADHQHTFAPPSIRVAGYIRTA